MTNEQRLLEEIKSVVKVLVDLGREADESVVEDAIFDVLDANNVPRNERGDFYAKHIKSLTKHFAPSGACAVTSGNSIENANGGRKFMLTPTQCEKLAPGEWLGAGSFASAYELKSDPNKVVKFTADPEDAQTALRLKGKNLKGAVRVYDVLKLKGLNAARQGESGYGDLFSLITEKVTPLDKKRHAKERKAITAFSTSLFPALESTTPKKLLARDTREWARADLEEATLACESMTGDAEFCDVTIKGMFDSVVEVAREAGTIVSDLHPGNWGIRDDGSLVILDFGVSLTDEPKKSIEELAGINRPRKGKRQNMARRKRSRKHLGQTDIVIPSARATRVIGLSLLGRAAVIGAVGLGVWWFFFSKKAVAAENKKKAAVPTGAETGAAMTGGDLASSTLVFKDPGSGVTLVGPSGNIITAEDKHIVEKGESWSNLASRAYGDYRWWPALWDANRASARFAKPNVLAVGDVVLIPRLPTGSKAYRDAIFARAEADRKWELAKAQKGAKAAGNRPASTFATTPIPLPAPGTSVAPLVPSVKDPAQTAQVIDSGSSGPVDDETREAAELAPSLAMPEDTEAELSNLAEEMKSGLKNR